MSDFKRDDIVVAITSTNFYRVNMIGIVSRVEQVINDSKGGVVLVNWNLINNEALLSPGKKLKNKVWTLKGNLSKLDKFSTSEQYEIFKKQEEAEE